MERKPLNTYGAKREELPHDVYIIRHPKFIKVGYSSDAKNRFPNIQTGCPIELHIEKIYTVIGKAQAEELEGLFHNEIEPFRYRGEWFRYSTQHIEIFNRIYDEFQSKYGFIGDVARENYSFKQMGKAIDAVKFDF